MPIFLSQADYLRFQSLVDYYRYARKMSYSRYCTFKTHLGLAEESQREIVQILSFCLLPNHFHLQIKVIRANELQTFSAKVFSAYALYFNKKYQRIGPVFQNRYKSIPVDSIEQLLYLSAYIHLNPLEAGLVNNKKSLLSYPYSSLPFYYGLKKNSFIDSKLILSYFRDLQDYSRFLFSSRRSASG